MILSSYRRITRAHMNTSTDHDLLSPLNWVTAKELAATLRKSVQTIYNLISAGGDLPPIYRPGGRTPLFLRPEVEAWLIKDRCVPAASRLHDENSDGANEQRRKRAAGE
jgi:predicted DNA-binding transcriptional regulator AlpA